MPTKYDLPTSPGGPKAMKIAQLINSPGTADSRPSTISTTSRAEVSTVRVLASETSSGGDKGGEGGGNPEARGSASSRTIGKRRRSRARASGRKEGPADATQAAGEMAGWGGGRCGAVVQQRTAGGDTEQQGGRAEAGASRE